MPHLTEPIELFGVMKMYVGCSCLACDKRRFPTMEEAVRKLEELGFNVFDFDLFEGWQHVNPSDVAENVEGWIDRLGSLDTREDGEDNIIASLNCGLSGELTDPDPATFKQCMRQIKAIYRLAEMTLAQNITLQPGPVQEGQTHQEAMDTLKGHLEEIAGIERYLSVGIGVETHVNSVIETPEAALNLAEDSPPGISLTYDPSHFVMQGIPLEETEPLLKHSTHVHIRNASEGNVQDTMQAGTMDFEWLVLQLFLDGYPSALTIEYFDDFDPDFSNVTALRDVLVGLGVGANAQWPDLDDEDLDEYPADDWDDFDEPDWVPPGTGFNPLKC